MQRDYLDYVQDIVASLKEIKDFIKGMDFAAFAQDKKTLNAVVRSLEVIGEAAKKVPEGIREKYADVPWKSMAGMRDKLIHEYFGVDEEIVWKVAIEELPPLEEVFLQILGEAQQQAAEQE